MKKHTEAGDLNDTSEIDLASLLKAAPEGKSIETLAQQVKRLAKKSSHVLFGEPKAAAHSVRMTDVVSGQGINIDAWESISDTAAISIGYGFISLGQHVHPPKLATVAFRLKTKRISRTKDLEYLIITAREDNAVIIRSTSQFKAVEGNIYRGHFDLAHFLKLMAKGKTDGVVVRDILEILSSEESEKPVLRHISNKNFVKALAQGIPCDHLPITIGDAWTLSEDSISRIPDTFYNRVNDHMSMATIHVADPQFHFGGTFVNLVTLRRFNPFGSDVSHLILGTYANGELDALCVGKFFEPVLKEMITDPTYFFSYVHAHNSMGPDERITNDIVVDMKIRYAVLENDVVITNMESKLPKPEYVDVIGKLSVDRVKLEAHAAELVTSHNKSAHAIERIARMALAHYSLHRRVEALEKRLLAGEYPKFDSMQPICDLVELRKAVNSLESGGVGIDSQVEQFKEVTRLEGLFA